MTGFASVAVHRRYDCFLGTTKERIARRYGVAGVTVVAERPRRGARRQEG
jgi:hypothetical protein